MRRSFFKPATKHVSPIWLRVLKTYGCRYSLQSFVDFNNNNNTFTFIVNISVITFSIQLPSIIQWLAWYMLVLMRRYLCPSLSADTIPAITALVRCAVMGVLHRGTNNGLMTFCYNKFSRSDVLSILLWSELVLISRKCCFFFSLSRAFSGSVRKYFSLYYPHHIPRIALNPEKPQTLM